MERERERERERDREYFDSLAVWLNTTVGAVVL